MRMLAFIIPAFVVCGCTTPASDLDDRSITEILDLPAEASPGVLNAVIEIPAGTVEKREFDAATGTFPIKWRNGKPRVIGFLPYPANYGFIPGTLMDTEEGGDGDAVDVFVLCGALPSGTVLEVDPIGIIELIDDGEQDDKVIALPRDPALRNMEATDIDELPAAIREILVTWLLNYDPQDSTEVRSVKGREAALGSVRRWRIDP